MPRHTAVLPEMSRHIAVLPEMSRDTAVLPEMSRHTAVLPDIVVTDSDTSSFTTLFQAPRSEYSLKSESEI